MAGRISRKSIEEKISEKEELIEKLEIRVGKEKKELDELNAQKKRREIENLYDYVANSGLSSDEAIEILKKHEDGGSIL